MMAGDDFADMYDTFAKLRTARDWRWGVKSAVARFSREVSTQHRARYGAPPLVCPHAVIMLSERQLAPLTPGS